MTETRREDEMARQIRDVAMLEAIVRDLWFHLEQIERDPHPIHYYITNPANVERAERTVR